MIVNFLSQNKLADELVDTEVIPEIVLGSTEEKMVCHKYFFCFDLLIRSYLRCQYFSKMSG